MKGKIEYAEITIYSLIVLLLVALSVTGYQGAQERKAAAAAGYMPSVIGIAVDYWATEPTEVMPPLYGLIASEAPYKAMARSISPLTYPLPGQSMDCIADIRCINRKGHEGYEGYIGRVVYTGGKESMIRWLYWPDEGTPPVTGHDLLLMGATEPAAANGYYDEAGEVNGVPYYLHTNGNFMIYFNGSVWWLLDYPDNVSLCFSRGEAEVTGSYAAEAGTGNVIVYPVNVTLSGATSPEACNGTYAEAGTMNGKPYYVHTSGDYKITFENVDFPVWYVTDAAISSYYFRYERPDSPLGSYVAFPAGEGDVVTSMP
jgi:hypothetical protein